MTSPYLAPVWAKRIGEALALRYLAADDQGKAKITRTLDVCSEGARLAFRGRLFAARHGL